MESSSLSEPHLHQDSGINASNHLNYIFKRKYPLQHKDLMQNENDLHELIKSLKLEKVKISY